MNTENLKHGKYGDYNLFPEEVDYVIIAQKEIRDFLKNGGNAYDLAESICSMGYLNSRMFAEILGFIRETVIK